MIRAVSFRNCMCFRDHQLMELQDGPNFIVGANATGKSSFFEIIRRCLSNKANTSTPSVTDIKYPAFALCKFKIREDLSDELPAESFLYSYLYVKHIAVDKQEKEMVKLVCNTDKDTCYLDLYIIEGDNFRHPKCTESFTICSNATSITDELEKLMKSSSFESFHEMINREKKKDAHQLLTHGDSISKCEDILQKIHDVVVLTFPIRSPGPTQWSHSQNISKGNENYNTASDKAEILQQLLDCDDVDQDRSREVFKTIIHPLEYNFKKDPVSSTINVVDGEGKNIRFLKVPEGIIEAKQFSLMFAHKKIQAIMLEEPDRGMHPSMIQKLRDLVIRKKDGKNKVMVFVTHQLPMINRWSMSRMYVCMRKRDAVRNWKHSIFKLSEKINNIHQEEEKLKEMLYATGVLFVEGNTDKSVIGSVFDQILETDHVEDFDNGNLNNLQKTIAGIQVISTEGTTSYNTLKNMAENLGIPFAFLFDKDAMFKSMADIAPPQYTNDWRKSTLFFVKILLQRIKNLEEESIEDESEEKRKLILKVLNTSITRTEKLRDVLKLNDKDLEKPTFTMITSFIKKVVLPSESANTLQEQKAKALGLPKSKHDSSTKDILDYMKTEKKVYLWGSGNIEDVICTSILEIREDEEIKENLLRSIFLLGKDTKKGKNSKDPVKETLKQMDSKTSESIAACLLKSIEMKTFLEFLSEFGEKRL